MNLFAFNYTLCVHQYCASFLSGKYYISISQYSFTMHILKTIVYILMILQLHNKIKSRDCLCYQTINCPSHSQYVHQTSFRLVVQLTFLILIFLYRFFIRSWCDDTVDYLLCEFIVICYNCTIFKNLFYIILLQQVQ